MSTWLLTGGAGYIGAHVLRALVDSGREVVVLDDLSTGHADRIPDGVTLVEASVLDTDAVRRALVDHSVDGVVHLAAKKAVGESIEQPLHYYRENVTGVVSLLEAMRDAQVTRLVYSSSAAVYGEPPWSPIREETPCAPLSPYGETKLIGEWMVRDAAAAQPLSWVSLRYFNVAGADSPELRDTSVNNLIPMVYAALARGEAPQVFGTDYPTPDGSCIRDYIHVADLADAHVLGLERLLRLREREETERRPLIYNLGNGTGYSVQQVIETAKAVTGRGLLAHVARRRDGDPPQLVAGATRAHQELGWRPRFPELETIIEHAWAWHQRRHQG